MSVDLERPATAGPIDPIQTPCVSRSNGATSTGGWPNGSLEAHRRSEIATEEVKTELSPCSEFTDQRHEGSYRKGQTVTKRERVMLNHSESQSSINNGDLRFRESGQHSTYAEDLRKLQYASVMRRCCDDDIVRETMFQSRAKHLVNMSMLITSTNSELWNRKESLRSAGSNDDIDVSNGIDSLSCSDQDELIAKALKSLTRDKIESAQKIATLCHENKISAASLVGKMYGFMVHIDDISAHLGLKANMFESLLTQHHCDAVNESAYSSSIRERLNRISGTASLGYCDDQDVRLESGQSVRFSRYARGSNASGLSESVPDPEHVNETVQRVLIYSASVLVVVILILVVLLVMSEDEDGNDSAIRRKLFAHGESRDLSTSGDESTDDDSFDMNILRTPLFVACCLATCTTSHAITTEFVGKCSRRIDGKRFVPTKRCVVALATCSMAQTIAVLVHVMSVLQSLLVLFAVSMVSVIVSSIFMINHLKRLNSNDTAIVATMVETPIQCVSETDEVKMPDSVLYVTGCYWSALNEVGKRRMMDSVHRTDPLISLTQLRAVVGVDGLNRLHVVESSVEAREQANLIALELRLRVRFTGPNSKALYHVVKPGHGGISTSAEALLANGDVFLGMDTIPGEVAGVAESKCAEDSANNELGWEERTITNIVPQVEPVRDNDGSWITNYRHVPLQLVMETYFNKCAYDNRNAVVDAASIMEYQTVARLGTDDLACAGGPPTSSLPIELSFSRRREIIGQMVLKKLEVSVVNCLPTLSLLCTTTNGNKERLKLMVSTLVEVLCEIAELSEYGVKRMIDQAKETALLEFTGSSRVTNKSTNADGTKPKSRKRGPRAGADDAEKERLIREKHAFTSDNISVLLSTIARLGQMMMKTSEEIGGYQHRMYMSMSDHRLWDSTKLCLRPGFSDTEHGTDAGRKLGTKIVWLWDRERNCVTRRSIINFGENLEFESEYSVMRLEIPIEDCLVAANTGENADKQGTQSIFDTFVPTTVVKDDMAVLMKNKAMLALGELLKLGRERALLFYDGGPDASTTISEYVDLHVVMSLLSTQYGFDNLPRWYSLMLPPSIPVLNGASTTIKRLHKSIMRNKSSLLQSWGARFSLNKIVSLAKSGRHLTPDLKSDLAAIATISRRPCWISLVATNCFDDELTLMRVLAEDKGLTSVDKLIKVWPDLNFPTEVHFKLMCIDYGEKVENIEDYHARMHENNPISESCDDGFDESLTTLHLRLLPIGDRRALTNLSTLYGFMIGTPSSRSHNCNIALSNVTTGIFNRQAEPSMTYKNACLGAEGQCFLAFVDDTVKGIAKVKDKLPPDKDINNLTFEDVRDLFNDPDVVPVLHSRIIARLVIADNTIHFYASKDASHVITRKALFDSRVYEGCRIGSEIVGNAIDIGKRRCRNLLKMLCISRWYVMTMMHHAILIASNNGLTHEVQQNGEDTTEKFDRMLEQVMERVTGVNMVSARVECDAGPPEYQFEPSYGQTLHDLLDSLDTSKMADAVALVTMESIENAKMVDDIECERFESRPVVTKRKHLIRQIATLAVTGLVPENPRYSGDVGDFEHSRELTYKTVVCVLSFQCFEVICEFAVNICSALNVDVPFCLTASCAQNFEDARRVSSRASDSAVEVREQIRIQKLDFDNNSATTSVANRSPWKVALRKKKLPSSVVMQFMSAAVDYTLYLDTCEEDLQRTFTMPMLLSGELMGSGNESYSRKLELDYDVPMLNDLSNESLTLKCKGETIELESEVMAKVMYVGGFADMESYGLSTIQLMFSAADKAYADSWIHQTLTKMSNEVQAAKDGNATPDLIIDERVSLALKMARQEHNLLDPEKVFLNMLEYSECHSTVKLTTACSEDNLMRLPKRSVGYTPEDALIREYISGSRRPRLNSKQLELGLDNEDLVDCDVTKAQQDAIAELPHNLTTERSTGRSKTKGGRVCMPADAVTIKKIEGDENGKTALVYKNGFCWLQFVRKSDWGDVCQQMANTCGRFQWIDLKVLASVETSKKVFRLRGKIVKTDAKNCKLQVVTKDDKLNEDPIRLHVVSGGPNSIDMTVRWLRELALVYPNATLGGAPSHDGTPDRVTLHDADEDDEVELEDDLIEDDVEGNVEFQEFEQYDEEKESEWYLREKAPRLTLFNCNERMLRIKDESMTSVEDRTDLVLDSCEQWMMVRLCDDCVHNLSSKFSFNKAPVGYDEVSVCDVSLTDYSFKNYPDILDWRTSSDGNEVFLGLKFRLALWTEVLILSSTTYDRTRTTEPCVDGRLVVPAMTSSMDLMYASSALSSFGVDVKDVSQRNNVLFGDSGDKFASALAEDRGIGAMAMANYVLTRRDGGGNLSISFADLTLMAALRSIRMSHPFSNWYQHERMSTEELGAFATLAETFRLTLNSRSIAMTGAFCVANKHCTDRVQFLANEPSALTTNSGLRLTARRDTNLKLLENDMYSSVMTTGMSLTMLYTVEDKRCLLYETGQHNIRLIQSNNDVLLDLAYASTMLKRPSHESKLKDGQWTFNDIMTLNTDNTAFMATLSLMFPDKLDETTLSDARLNGVLPHDKFKSLSTVPEVGERNVLVGALIYSIEDGNACFMRNIRSIYSKSKLLNLIVAKKLNLVACHKMFRWKPHHQKSDFFKVTNEGTMDDYMQVRDVSVSSNTSLNEYVLSDAHFQMDVSDELEVHEVMVVEDNKCWKNLLVCGDERVFEGDLTPEGYVCGKIALRELIMNQPRFHVYFRGTVTVNMRTQTVHIGIGHTVYSVQSVLIMASSKGLKIGANINEYKSLMTYEATVGPMNDGQMNLTVDRDEACSLTLGVQQTITARPMHLPRQFLRVWKWLFATIVLTSILISFSDELHAACKTVSWCRNLDPDISEWFETDDNKDHVVVDDMVVIVYNVSTNVTNDVEVGHNKHKEFLIENYVQPWLIAILTMSIVGVVSMLAYTLASIRSMYNVTRQLRTHEHIDLMKNLAILGCSDWSNTSKVRSMSAQQRQVSMFLNDPYKIFCGDYAGTSDCDGRGDRSRDDFSHSTYGMTRVDPIVVVNPALDPSNEVSAVSETVNAEYNSKVTDFNSNAQGRIIALATEIEACPEPYACIPELRFLMRNRTLTQNVVTTVFHQRGEVEICKSLTDSEQAELNSMGSGLVLNAIGIAETNCPFSEAVMNMCILRVHNLIGPGLVAMEMTRSSANVPERGFSIFLGSEVDSTMAAWLTTSRENFYTLKSSGLNRTLWEGRLMDLHCRSDVWTVYDSTFCYDPTYLLTCAMTNGVSTVYAVHPHSEEMTRKTNATFHTLMANWRFEGDHFIMTNVSGSGYVRKFSAKTVRSWLLLSSVTVMKNLHYVCEPVTMIGDLRICKLTLVRGLLEESPTVMCQNYHKGKLIELNVVDDAHKTGIMSTMSMVPHQIPISFFTSFKGTVASMPDQRTCQLQSCFNQQYNGTPSRQIPTSLRNMPSTVALDSFIQTTRLVVEATAACDGELTLVSDVINDDGEGFEVKSRRYKPCNLFGSCCYVNLTAKYAKNMLGLLENAVKPGVALPGLQIVSPTATHRLTIRVNKRSKGDDFWKFESETSDDSEFAQTSSSWENTDTCNLAMLRDMELSGFAKTAQKMSWKMVLSGVMNWIMPCGIGTLNCALTFSEFCRGYDIDSKKATLMPLPEDPRDINLDEMDLETDGTKLNLVIIACNVVELAECKRWKVELIKAYRRMLTYRKKTLPNLVVKFISVDTGIYITDNADLDPRCSVAAEKACDLVIKKIRYVLSRHGNPKDLDGGVYRLCYIAYPAQGDSMNTFRTDSTGNHFVNSYLTDLIRSECSDTYDWVTNKARRNKAYVALTAVTSKILRVWPYAGQMHCLVTPLMRRPVPAMCMFLVIWVLQLPFWIASALISCVTSLVCGFNICKHSPAMENACCGHLSCNLYGRVYTCTGGAMEYLALVTISVLWNIIAAVLALVIGTVAYFCRLIVCRGRHGQKMLLFYDKAESQFKMPDSGSAYMYRSWFDCWDSLERFFPGVVSRYHNYQYRLVYDRNSVADRCAACSDLFDDKQYVETLEAIRDSIPEARRNRQTLTEEPRGDDDASTDTSAGVEESKGDVEGDGEKDGSSPKLADDRSAMAKVSDIIRYVNESNNDNMTKANPREKFAGKLETQKRIVIHGGVDAVVEPKWVSMLVVGFNFGGIGIQKDRFTETRCKSDIAILMTLRPEILGDGTKCWIDTSNIDSWSGARLKTCRENVVEMLSSFVKFCEKSSDDPAANINGPTKIAYLVTATGTLYTLLRLFGLTSHLELLVFAVSILPVSNRMMQELEELQKEVLELDMVLNEVVIDDMVSRYRDNKSHNSNDEDTELKSSDMVRVLCTKERAATQAPRFGNSNHVNMFAPSKIGQVEQDQSGASHQTDLGPAFATSDGSMARASLMNPTLAYVDADKYSMVDAKQCYTELCLMNSMKMLIVCKRVFCCNFDPSSSSSAVVLQLTPNGFVRLVVSDLVLFKRNLYTNHFEVDYISIEYLVACSLMNISYVVPRSAAYAAVSNTDGVSFTSAVLGSNGVRNPDEECMPKCTAVLCAKFNSFIMHKGNLYVPSGTDLSALTGGMLLVGKSVYRVESNNLLSVVKLLNVHYIFDWAMSTA